ncbi:chemerin-like receptor 1 [Narcine bancroftii]|uniref:chemerin-like receptor 1 n=1 Tax=Narcine bancroftii TaxID=1343680 RepID=UPI003831EB08
MASTPDLDTTSHTTLDPVFPLPHVSLPPMYVFSLVVKVLTCILGLPGNVLVIYITSRLMQPSANAAWCQGLAVADLAFIFTLPFSATYLSLGHHWPFGNVLCKLISSLAVISMVTSSFTLALISLDRCLSVLRPIWSQNHRGQGIARKACLLSCATALLLSLPTWVFRKTVVRSDSTVACHQIFLLPSEEAQQSQAEEEEYLRLLWVAQSRMTGVLVSQVVLGFLLPILTMMACYTLIGLQLRTLGRRRGWARPFGVMGTVVMAFMICLLPLQVLKLMVIASPMSPSVPQVVKLGLPLASSLVYLNSCLNPLLYLVLGGGLRTGLRRRSLCKALKWALTDEPTSERTVSHRETSL